MVTYSLSHHVWTEDDKGLHKKTWNKTSSDNIFLLCVRNKKENVYYLFCVGVFVCLLPTRSYGR